MTVQEVIDAINTHQFTFAELIVLQDAIETAVVNDMAAFYAADTEAYDA